MRGEEPNPPKSEMTFKGGASAPTVQQLAGHLHLSVTQRYAHTNEDLKKEAVQVFTRRSA